MISTREHFEGKGARPFLRAFGDLRAGGAGLKGALRYPLKKSLTEKLVDGKF